jgi:hypothetical protein
MVSLPDEQRLQRATTKYVLRRAMAERLPEAVTARPDATKADFTHLFDEALEALGERFFSDDLHVGANGWVMPEGARTLHRSIHRSPGHDAAARSGATWTLWTIAALEFWYRGVFVDADSRCTPWRRLPAVMPAGLPRESSRGVASGTAVRS